MLKFSKMHGLGNDFVVIDAINQSVELTPSQIRWLADRRLGIGCDQLLLVETSATPDVDFRYRIFNADGGEVAQCGNGARCFALFVRNQRLTDKDTIAVETASGVIYPSLHSGGQVSVDMGPPGLMPSEVPFIADKAAQTYMLVLAEVASVEIVALSMGNPHAVMLVDDIESAPVTVLGAMIESHERFPERVNVGFMQIISREEIRLRVYERGAGETLACGTGACAAMVAGVIRGLLANEVRVHLPGGELKIAWAGDGESVWMTGPAQQVFDGEIAWSTIDKN